MGSCQASNVIEMNSQEDAKILSNKKRLALSTKLDIQTVINEQKIELLFGIVNVNAEMKKTLMHIL